MPPPFVAVVPRKPDGNAEEFPNLSPAQLNERLYELVAPQKAPDPPRQGDVPARPARMPMYSVLAMRQWRAVMADMQSAVMGKTAFEQFVSEPRGKSLSWDERANIQREYAQAYGNNFTVVPQTEDEIILRMQMGM